MPPSCNNQQRRPANIIPHLLRCSEATLDCRSRGRLQLTYLDNTNAPCVQTLHLPEQTQAALAPLGAAVHRSAHLVQLYEDSDASLSHLDARQPLHHMYATKRIRVRWLAPPCAYTDNLVELSIRVPIVNIQPCAATKRYEACKNAAGSRQSKGSVRRADSLTGSHKRSADQLDPMLTPTDTSRQSTTGTTAFVCIIIFYRLSLTAGNSFVACSKGISFFKCTA